MMNKYEQGLVYNFEKLGCYGLAAKLRNVFSSGHVRDEDLLKVMTDTTEEEILRIKHERADRLLHLASLQNAYANLDMIEYKPERNLDRTLVERLSTCDYIGEAANIIIVGAAGTGKTFLAKAFAVQACNEGYRTRIFNLRALLRDLLERDRDDCTDYSRRLRYIANIPLLVIDEWFSISPEKKELVILHELIDARYGRHATIICSQMVPDNWARYCGNQALGESITGRLKSHSYCFELKGDDIRKRHHQRP